MKLEPEVRPDCSTEPRALPAAGQLAKRWHGRQASGLRHELSLLLVQPTRLEPLI